MFDGERFVSGPFVAVSMQPETCGRMLVSASIMSADGRTEEMCTRWLTMPQQVEIGRLLARSYDLAMSRAAQLLWEAEEA